MDIFGYLDPGTGSMIIQALVGAGVAIGVVGKTYWHKITGFAGKKKSKSSDLRNTVKNDEEK